VQDGLLRWLRAAELTCDRAALLVAQDPRVVVSALMKLAGGSPSFAAELNVDAFLQQVGVGVSNCRVAGAGVSSCRVAGAGVSSCSWWGLVLS
jgi:Zn-dependent protease with chaperone function